MKNPDLQICALIEIKMNPTMDEINKKDSILDADQLVSEVRILNWILYLVCTVKNYKTILARKNYS